MGQLESRLAKLEEQIEVPEDELRRRAHQEFLPRLTREELEWLMEPACEVQKLVPCPRFETIECGCQSDERRRRGFEAHPEFFDEYLSRRDALLERADEIMARGEGRASEHQSKGAKP